MKFSILLALALSYTTLSSAQGQNFRPANADKAEQLTKEFAKLTKDSPCENNAQACVEDQFAQCVGGKFQLNSCGGGELKCVVLPLVNKPGTSITCSTEADRLARLADARGGKAPENGKNGQDGKVPKNGKDGKDGKAPKNGKDGKDGKAPNGDDLKAPDNGDGEKAPENGKDGKLPPDDNLCKCPPSNNDGGNGTENDNKDGGNGKENDNKDGGNGKENDNKDGGNGKENDNKDGGNGKENDNKDGGNGKENDNKDGGNGDGKAPENGDGKKAPENGKDGKLPPDDKLCKCPPSNNDGDNGKENDNKDGGNGKENDNKDGGNGKENDNKDGGNGKENDNKDGGNGDGKAPSDNDKLKTPPANGDGNNQDNLKTPPANGDGNLADIRKQNAADAKALQKKFDALKPDDKCNDNDVACVDNKFAQCSGGKFALSDCASGTICAALPLVLKKGTTVACTTEADRDARLKQSETNTK